MLLKTAMVKASVDQMELVNVTLDFTWRIVQVSLKNVFFLITVRTMAEMDCLLFDCTSLISKDWM